MPFFPGRRRGAACILSIRATLRTGKIMGLMLAPLCASWSQARNRTNAIHNYAYPWGLPQSERGKKAGRRPFSLNDQAAFDLGIKTMSSALRLAKSVRRTGTPWILENPLQVFVGRRRRPGPLLRQRASLLWSSIFVLSARRGRRGRGCLSAILTLSTTRH